MKCDTHISYNNIISQGSCSW